MIKYFTYYSFGGYKDMLVGGQDEQSCQTFYMPLAADDTANDIAKIKVYEGDSFDDYPSVLGSLMGTGGFSLFYSKMYGGKSLLVVRDVHGSEKDERDRAIPFVFAMLGDASDASVLAAAAASLINHDKSIDKVIGGLLHYDPYKNGLCFENGRLNEWLERVKGSGSDINTLDHGRISLLKVSALLIATINDSQQLRTRLSLPASTVTTRPACILPEDNPMLCASRTEEWEKEKAKAAKGKMSKSVKTIAIIGAVGLVVLLIILLYNN